VVLALVLVAVLGFGVYRLVAGSRQTAVTRVAAGGRAVSHHQAGRARPRPASKNHAAVVPAPPVRAQALTPASVVAFGSGGGDNPQFAHRALGGRRGGGWRSDWYTTAQFGNLYSGTGLLLDMGRPVTLTAARIILGRARGASLQIRMGPAPTLADRPPVAHAGDTGGVVRLRLAAPAHGRYVLLWFTRLPAMPSGNFRVGVYNIRLDGHA
jgi:hypothetical protein